jgi:hypothetical protein
MCFPEHQTGLQCFKIIFLILSKDRPVTMGVKINIPPGSPFTIRNIPFGVISTEANPTQRCATAIGEYAIDLGVYSKTGHLSKLLLETSIKETLSQVNIRSNYHRKKVLI